MPAKKHRNGPSPQNKSVVQAIPSSAFQRSRRALDAPPAACAFPSPQNTPPDCGVEISLADSASSGLEQTLRHTSVGGRYDVLRTLLGDEPEPARVCVPQADVRARTAPDAASELPPQVGHIRAPVLAREPTALEAFSRTLRTYVPAAIPIPSAGPSPARVSRPASYGSFLTPPMSPRLLEPDAAAPGGWARRESYEDALFDLDDGASSVAGSERRAAARYPGAEEPDEVVWAGWDAVVDEEPARPRCVAHVRGCGRLLVIGYPAGLQIWDCSDLGAVSEILNLSGPQWGAVACARVLPPPALHAGDGYKEQRPLLGILSRTGEYSEFIVYSLRTHDVVKRLSFTGLHAFSVAADFIVLSTTNPPSLRIISSCTFATLYTISSASLVLYSPSFAKNNASISHLELDQKPITAQHDYVSTTIPQPTFALSNGLLAFASPNHSSYTVSSSLAHARTNSSPPHLDASAKLGLTQADVGRAAVKLGGTVLSGMKTLGGFAISAARAGVTAAIAADQPGAATARPSAGGLTNLFQSRGAPAGRDGAPDRTYSAGSHDGGAASPSTQSSRSDEQRARGEPAAAAHALGSNVTVLDLRPLLSGSAEPARVADFPGSRRQAVGMLRFAPDGTSLAVCAQDGHTSRIYRLAPAARAQRAAADAGAVGEGKGERAGDSSGLRQKASSGSLHGAVNPPQHVYDLRRGRTAAVVDDVGWANDGRWFAMGTRKRTVHLFAINPYGGPPDEASHLTGKVSNPDSMTRQLTEVHPIARLRMDKTPAPDRAHVPPVAFTFIRLSDSSVPPALLPLPTVPLSVSSSPSSIHSLSQPSPTHASITPTNYQDILVFDPYDATLSLRRLFVEQRTNDHLSGASGSFAGIATTSISLPGIGPLGRLNASPTKPSEGQRRGSGFSQMLHVPDGLIARETRVGSWHLRRGRDWPEVRQPMRQLLRGAPSKRPTKADWLSCAELSTFSPSPRVLPRTLYLTHQFSFHSLGEDYHALIRSYHFDIPTTKLEVRRAIEVSAYPTGFGESFVQGIPTTRDVGRVSSSFDEPLASALSADIQYMNPSPPVLPMYPNGAPGANARSLRNAIPIRTVAAGLSDSMHENLGRLRRRVGKARSRRAARRADDGTSSPVPLEFDDDEDDDFAGADIGSYSIPEDDLMCRSASREEGDSAESISTPSSTLDPLPVEDDVGEVWQGWEPEDQEAIEDAERFDDLSVGIMDEEQETIRDIGKRRLKGRIVRKP
ncbi:hypothetical protein WOLCODRAFT_132119 [Wolfiporia cocos MD-104 SS10]|uniref:BCAS3 WD40 domain-containing protein n=1 Tax=Wolfiporia cocos (strain MD-104) TaxID=742152 RepID=A0A2H3JPH0_WOLCO|nr:hypothetical protein WOLCODRAFT_132119 [Wolfiporia cocos MD-104 SS10]